MINQKQNKNEGEILLTRYLSGTASMDEIRHLRVLAESSAKLKEELSQSEKVIQQMDSLKLMKAVNTSSAFLKLKSRLKKYQQKHRWVYYWQKIAAVLIIPLVFVSVFQFISQDKKELLGFIPGLEYYNEISTPSGLRSNFKLPDGTEVWLNGKTKIKYPLFFSGTERRIQLEGEAYFEVAKDQEKPFIVDLGVLHVEALGTAFNCMAYPEDHLIESTLSEGSVKITKIIKNKEKWEYILEPGQVLTYNLDSDKFFLKETNMDKYLSWRSGKFIFKDDPLEVICQKLGRWFNTDIRIEDEKLKGYTFTGTFREEGLREILELISLTTPMSYTVETREINKNNEYGALKVIIWSKN